MIVLPLEISALIWGLFILARGRLTLSRHRVAEGKPAQAAALLLLLPLPVGLLASFFYHQTLIHTAVTADFSTLWPLYAGEAIFTLGCVAGALAISWAKGTSPLAHEVSWQSWVEVVGVLPLVAAGVCVWWFREYLSTVQEVFLWGVLLLTALILWQRGWLKLFGPVLFYDMVRAARRGRYVWMRCIYAGFLLFILSMTFVSTVVNQSNLRESASRIAENYFEAFMLVQLIVVIILTPAYVAGSIADEKERKTLEFLLATDLRNREIVLSKLLSRLANVTLFIMTGLPILSFVQFLGGVDPNLVMAGFGFTAMLMLGLGGISIFHSVAFRRPRDAIAMTYLLVIAYHAVGTILYISRISPMPWGVFSYPIWFGANPPTIGTLVDGLNAGNLLAVIIKVQLAGAGGGLATRIPEVLLDFSIFHGLVAVVSGGWAVLRLRAIALAQLHGKARTPFGRFRLIDRPSCGELPMLWKEVCVEGGLRFNWTSTFLIVILFVLSLIPFIVVISNYWLAGGGNVNRPWETLQSDINVWIRIIGTLVGCVLLLGVAVRASTTVSGERDKQTFDALLTTPLSSTSILWSKWVGSVLSVRLGWIWLGFIWIVGAITGGLHVFALPLIVGAWTVFAGVAAMVGLWYSMVAKSSTRATVWTLLTLIGLGGGHWLPWFCCLSFMVGGPDRGWEYLLKFQAGVTPPFVLGFLQFHGEEFVRHPEHSEMMELLFFCFFGLFLWAMAAAIFWITVLAPRFRVITGRYHRKPEGFETTRWVRSDGSTRQPVAVEAILIEEEPSDDDWSQRARRPPE